MPSPASPAIAPSPATPHEFWQQIHPPRSFETAGAYSTFAAAVARHLGHSRYVPLGTSRKFWYLEELSVPMSSITTKQEKRLYVDPRMLPLIEGRRVALVDDVISSGSSILSGLALLTASGINPAVIGAAMLQSDRWREKIAAFGPEWPERVRGVFATPLLTKAEDGWRA